MLLDLLALLASLFAPAAVPDRAVYNLPDPPIPVFTVRAIVATSASGSLCVIDPMSGALVHEAAANAVDVVTVHPGVGSIRVLSPGQDGLGEVATYSLTETSLEKTDTRPFSGEGGRLVDAGERTIGYSFDEGTTLFSLDGASSTGVVEGHPRSVLALPAPGSTTVVAIEDEGLSWALRRSRVTGAIVEDLGVKTMLAHVSGATSALVSAEGQPIVVTLSGHHLTAAREDGTQIAKAWVSATHAEIADAISLGDRGIMVLTRPTAKLYLLTASDAVAIPLKGAGTIPDAPWFSHRLALDADRDRLWVATDEALVRVQLGSLLATRVSSCSATSVTTVWARDER